MQCLEISGGEANAPMVARLRGVTRGAREAKCPGAESLRGAPNDCGGAKKQTMSQVLSSMQYICFLKTSNSNMVAPNLFPAPGAV